MVVHLDRPNFDLAEGAVGHWAEQQLVAGFDSAAIDRPRGDRTDPGHRVGAIDIHPKVTLTVGRLGEPLEELIED